MKALVLTAPSLLEMQDVPPPAPADDEILVRIRACGICGSDIHGWDGSSGRRRPPLIMGHEAAGEIAAVGKSAKRFCAGQRVTFDSTVYCGTCEDCRSGHVNLCRSRRVLGVAPVEYKQDGAFAEYLVVPERIVYAIPDELSYPHAAMIEPVSIAIHAVQRLGTRVPTTAVVVGTGMIGLLVVQALRWFGAKSIIAVDLEPTRLAMARKFGATHTFQLNTCDVPAELTRLTNGRGVDAAFEVVGIEPSLKLAIQVTRPGGDVVLVGNLAAKVEFPLQHVVTRELTLHGSCSSAGEYPLCIDLIARGVIQVEPLISAKAPLEDGPSWFARLSSKDGGKHMKVILEP